jgi:GGDEF domain-containing protein
MDTSTPEIATMENTTHGGVMTLLRMARTRCGASLAFAALQGADGRFAIAAFPPLGSESPWGIESIEELAHHAWEDPSLLSDPVLVRTTRLLAPTWSTEQQAKVAAVPLSDPGVPEAPWGLLCVAEPMKGYFEHDELQALSALAVRLTSYLRARQELFEASDEPGAAGDQDEPPAGSWEPPATPAAMVDTPTAEPAPAERAAGYHHTATNGQRAPQTPAAPETPAAPSSEPSPPVVPEAAALIAAALLPDPLTGLPGLASLLAHLGRMLADPPGRRAVGVLVVDLVPAGAGDLSDAVLTTAAAALRSQVRGDDLVTRVGERTFAVAVELRGAADPAAVRQRIVDTLSAATSSLPLAPAIRSALAIADESSGPEEVLGRAAGQLAD